jgi:hypothetical protein
MNGRKIRKKGKKKEKKKKKKKGKKKSKKTIASPHPAKFTPHWPSGEYPTTHTFIRSELGRDSGNYILV